MSGLPWYKRDPDSFIRGCADGQLTLEEIGAYTLLIDEMYRRGGPFIDEPRAGCALLRCDVRVWQRLRAALLRKGKIYATAGKFLSNVRVEQELKAQYDLREQRSRSARLSAQVRRSYPLATEYVTANSDASALEDNEKAQAQAHAHTQQSKIEKKIPPTEVVGSAPTSIDEPVAKAMEAYNEAAKRAGWVTARMPIGAQRRRQVRARLKAIGFDGWTDLIAEAEGQPFLGGSNDRGWRMDLEFFASERGSTRILEGKYRKPGDKPRPPPAADLKAERERVWREDRVWNDAWGLRPDHPDYPDLLSANGGTR